jgi:hypothetical protein
MPQSRPALVARAALLVAVAAMSLIASSCGDPVPTGSPVCRRGSSRVTVFQGPDGECIPRDRLIGHRCDAVAPLIVFEPGGDAERRFLGGSFAVPVAALPEGAVTIGVGDGAQLVTVRDDPRWVYTVRGSSIERWLPLPPEGLVVGGPRAFMLGNSILEGGAPALALALPDWTLEVDASNGRSSGEGASIAEVRTVQDPVVVVELGTNDRDPDAFRSNAQRILRTFRDVPLVLWQTVEGPPEVVATDEVNDQILALAGRRPNVSLADWATEVPDEILSDGVHPDPEHQDAMAALVAPLLRTWWRAVTEEPGCT